MEVAKRRQRNSQGRNHDMMRAIRHPWQHKLQPLREGLMTISHGDAWPAVVDVMYAPGLLYKPKPEDAQRFADLAEAGYIGAVEGPHGGFAGYELRKRGWELIVRRMGYES